MYKTKHISTICPEVKSGNCGVNNIYDFDHLNKTQFFTWLQTLRPCNTSYYPLWYWMTLILSITALVRYCYSYFVIVCIVYVNILAQIIYIQELHSMYQGMEPRRNFLQHIYKFVPLQVRRDVRVLSTVLMFNITVLFIIGVVKVNILDVACMTYS